MSKMRYKLFTTICYIIGTIIVGWPLASSAISSDMPILFFVLFIALLLGAKFQKGSLLIRYCLAYMAMIVIIEGILIYLPDFNLFSRFLFNLIIIITYLLPDVVSPIVVGLGIGYVFYSYRPIVGEDVIGGIFGALTMALLSSVISLLMRRAIHQRDKYYKLSITDSLTGLYTLNHILQEGQNLLDTINNVSILLIDLNDFKRINDTFGHITGNSVISQFSELLQSITCDCEPLLGRLGGDEFVILLRHCDAEQVDALISKLQSEVNGAMFFGDMELPPIAITCSIGKAIANDLNIMNIQELLNIADMDMYYNKHEKYKLIKNIDLDFSTIPVSCLSYLKSIQEKDMYTYIHSQYTAYYAYLLAKKMQLPEKTLEDLFIAGWLHDIGKMLIPNTILRKPNQLNLEEYNAIKEHALLGDNLLRNVELSDTTRNAIIQHHERWDGSGYPNGIVGENISIEGRIMQIADTFSALTIKRLYKPLLQLKDAIDEIRRNSGTQFDPYLVDMLIDIMLQDDIVEHI